MNRILQSAAGWPAGLLALVLASARPRPNVSSTITVASDYDFRGITQTGPGSGAPGQPRLGRRKRPVRGPLGQQHRFRRGRRRWLRDVDLNVEVDFILRLRGLDSPRTWATTSAPRTTSTWATTTTTTTSTTSRSTRGLGYKILSDQALVSRRTSATPTRAPGTLEANWGHSAGLRSSAWLSTLGYNGGDYWSDADDIGLDEFYDYSVGLTRTFGHFDFAVKYIDGSDLKEADCSGRVRAGRRQFSSESQGRIFSVSTTFPWADAEE